MTTFRKLPTSRPKMPARMAAGRVLGGAKRYRSWSMVVVSSDGTRMRAKLTPPPRRRASARRPGGIQSALSLWGMAEERYGESATGWLGQRRGATARADGGYRAAGRRLDGDRIARLESQPPRQRRDPESHPRTGDVVEVLDQHRCAEPAPEAEPHDQRADSVRPQDPPEPDGPVPARDAGQPGRRPYGTGFGMLFSRVATDGLGPAAAAPFDSGRVVGIILVGQWGRHQQLNELAARKVPIVVWGAQLPQQLYCCVGSDNVSGGMLATQHLLELGRRRIAFFGDIELPEPAQRYRGYCAALEKHGIAVDPRLQVSTPFLPIGGSAAVEALQARAISYDAVFACSDLLAMTAIDSLRAHGKRVPDDVAVVGYDDIDQSAYFHPRLTTIRQPIGAAGRALVAALLALIDGAPAASVELPTQLIVRASAGEERGTPT